MEKYNQPVYCYTDESCHIQNDGNDFLVIGTAYCLRANLKKIKKEIIKIKNEFGLDSSDELKWSKVTSGNINLYKRIIDFVYLHDSLRIRTILAKGKNKLDFKTHKKSYKEWYNSMHYLLFRTILDDILPKYNNFRIRYDTADRVTNSNYSTVALYLSRHYHNSKQISFTIEDSKEHQIMQITDIIIGAISYKARNLTTSKGKLELIKYIEEKFRISLVSKNSLSEKKFNRFIWGS